MGLPNLVPTTSEGVSTFAFISGISVAPASGGQREGEASNSSAQARWGAVALHCLGSRQLLRLQVQSVRLGDVAIVWQLGRARLR